MQSSVLGREFQDLFVFVDQQAVLIGELSSSPPKLGLQALNLLPHSDRFQNRNGRIGVFTGVYSAGHRFIVELPSEMCILLLQSRNGFPKVVIWTRTVNGVKGNVSVILFTVGRSRRTRKQSASLGYKMIRLNQVGIHK